MIVWIHFTSIFVLFRLQIQNIVTTEFCQGRTMRWAVAWTFLPDVVTEVRTRWTPRAWVRNWRQIIACRMLWSHRTEIRRLRIRFYSGAHWETFFWLYVENTRSQKCSIKLWSCRSQWRHFFLNRAQQERSVNQNRWSLIFLRRNFMTKNLHQTSIRNIIWFPGFLILWERFFWISR